MKLSATRRALILANIFNSLVAIYFIIIAIVSLVQLRWYHQLTITVKVRHIITLTTSYFAFIILLLVGLLLLGLFIASALRLTSKHVPQSRTTLTSGGGGSELTPLPGEVERELVTNELEHQQELQAINLNDGDAIKTPRHHLASPMGGPFYSDRSANGGRAIVLRDTSISEESNASICCSIIWHLVATIGLILILLLWLFNTGELVRDSISTQLDYAFARYQFTNRSNHYSIAIDGMQDVNNCCGSLDFTDFPHQRVSGLSSGHYPGSCCGKHIFGVNARVLCTADEIYRAKQTSGCTTILANYYDLISLLLVPVALVCLFVNITIIALITISKRGNINLGHHHHAFTHLGEHHSGAAAAAVGNSNYQNRANLRRARRQQHPQQAASPMELGDEATTTTTTTPINQSAVRHQESIGL